MARKQRAEVRIRPKETVKFGELEVTNRTANSVTIRKTVKGVILTNCCLEEQGI